MTARMKKMMTGANRAENITDPINAKKPLPRKGEGFSLFKDY